MNGTHGDSPWTIVANTIAYATRIWNVDSRSVFVLSTITVFYAFAGSKLDLLCNAAFSAYLNRTVLAVYIQTAVQYLPTFLLCMIVALTSYLALASRNSRPSWRGPGKPDLIPCRTTHRRFFPEKHSFSYSYLTVGIPVGYKGSANGMIGVDEQPRSRLEDVFPLAKVLLRSWFHVQASDHLQRSQDELDLRGKLDSYLRSEEADPADFPHAYLVTAPRFAGYHFNPVSLWYLYSVEKSLSAIVFEVNNTIDERRPYFLVQDSTTESTHSISGGQPRFKSSQLKDFHVSPFNSRKGSYSVLASDPLGPGMDGCRGIDVTITLNSSKGHPKLVARLFSEGQAMDPATLGPFSKLRFLVRWCWVGFATLPRIFKEALVLYRRKLYMVDNPEPLIGTLGKHPNSVEKTLEVCFREYLDWLVCQSEKPLSVKYRMSGLLSATETIFTSLCGTHSPNDDTLEVRVLTPAFYSRFIQYANDLEAMTTEFVQNKTIWLNKPELLPNIFVKTDVAPQPMGFTDVLFVGAVRYMRKSLPNALFVSTPGHPQRTGVKDAHLSSMDAYMILHGGGGLKRQYQWATLRQLIADSYFMGRVELLDLATSIVRVGIAWASVSSLTQIARCARE